MFTTNTASKGLAMTYVQRREECEKLLKIAREMESFASKVEKFQDDRAFEELETRYKKQLLSIHSLSL
jgi:hypothetical protein